MSTPKKSRKPKKRLTKEQHAEFDQGVELHEAGQPLPEDASEHLRAGYESVPEEDVPKSAIEQLKEEYEHKEGAEFAGEYVPVESDTFHVVSNSGVLVSPKTKKPLEFSEADAAEVARFLGEARPGAGVHVRPIS